MSKLKELINKFCPNGVEYKKLSEVCKFQNGFAFKSKLFNTDGLPILRITNILDGKLSENGYVYFNKSDYSNSFDQYKVKKNSIVVAMSGATTGKIGYNYKDTTYYLNQRVGMFIPNVEVLLNRYLFHWLLIKSDDIYKISSGTGAQPNLSSVKMMEFLIPIPPMEVQKEVVHILDNLMKCTEELIENLKKELTLRKKQYEYYRDELLTFGNNIEYKKLQDILTIKNGSDYKQFGKGNIPVYGSGGIITYIDHFSYDKPSVLIPRKGSIHKLYYVEKPFWNVDTIFYTDIDVNQILPKFLYFYLQKEHLEKYNIAGGVPSLTQKVLNQIKIPIPSLDEQKRIVEILDKFNALASDISVQISTEIKARQEQYEYYLNKLLEF